MRKLAAILLLVALAAGAWWAARWYKHKDDLRATVIFKSADELRRGNDVVADAIVIGRVTKVARLDGQDAVSIRVSPQYRKEVMTDSLFSIRGDAPSARLEIDNTIAVGKPVADGTVLYAREDKISRWLAEQGKKIAPIVRGLGQRAGELFDEYRSETLDQELETLKEQIPEWKKQGEEFARERIAEAEKRIADIEADLRKSKKKAEADKLRAKFKQWLNDAKKKLESDDK
ncbi:MAG TPA: hypothetical protein VIL97_09830 [Thermoanaerobaculia bacterium]